jgi:hypothetical protein
MRKFVAFLVAVAATVVVAGAAGARPAVTISLSRPTVVYGGNVTLSGKVSNNSAGESVQVMAEAYPATTFTALGSPVTTTAGGHWRDVVEPTIQTSYKATWKGATSGTVTVKVRPMVTLTLVNAATGTFSTKVTAARAFTGKFVNVQRVTTTGVVTVKKVKLDSSSSATFHVRLHSGLNRLRVVLPVSQAAPGYIGGFSKVLRVTR